MLSKLSLVLISLSLFSISGCSTGNSDSLSAQDLDTVSFFCNDYSNFNDETTSSVLNLESDYLSNVAILNEKYPDNLELNQLSLSVQLAFEYADWVRATSKLQSPTNSIQIAIHELGESTFGNSPSPPIPASAVTEGLTKSCKPFKD